MNTIYDTLNDRQKEAVLHTDGPLLILAGAGSGKTRVLTHRIAYLIAEKGVNPWNILAITFTNKAAHEMRERVDKIAGSEGGSVWVSTFHSTCVRILRRHIDRLGYDNNFTIYDADDQKTLIKEICRKMNIDTKKVKERALLAQISHAKDELLNPDEMEMNAGADFNQKRAAQVYREYQAALRRNNALDFDDLICKTVELFQNCGDVLQSYQERFRYIMVDEYQDTNTAQFKFVSLLASRYENLCVVGDDDQSIYRFRGANIGNILGFERVFPDAKVIRLEQNYRSTQNILDAANNVIHNNIGRKDKALWTDRGSGNRIHFRPFDNAYDEAEYIASDIKSKKYQGTSDYGQCAVLYRTNAQSRLLEESFISEGIPYDVVGGVNFYARKEIKDLLAYLKTIDNGKDDLAVKRIINVPRRGIGAASVNKVQDFADHMGISFFEAMQRIDEITSIGKAGEKLRNFALMIMMFRTKLQHGTLEDLITDVVETTQYTKELEESDDDDAEDRLQNIDELISKVVSFEQEREELGEEASLSAFLEEVALVADIDGVDKDDNKVLLMTLHSAKGLEFSQVYLAGMEDGVFPSYMTITSDDPTEIEEERRLAYVGITRAKDDLTITYAKQRMLRGETQYNPISRFIKEIPENLMDNKLPVPKKWGYDDYEEDSRERSHFKTKPFAGSGFNTVYQKPVLSDDVFDKPRNNWEAAEQAVKKNNWEMPTAKATVKTATVPSNKTPVMKQQQPKDIASILVSRPKAVIKKKETPAANKPYIAKSLDGLTKGMPTTQGGLSYGVGDRVRHIKYGDGTVQKVEKDVRDYKITVAFDGAGQKIMYAAFAKLQKI